MSATRLPKCWHLHADPSKGVYQHDCELMGPDQVTVNVSLGLVECVVCKNKRATLATGVCWWCSQSSILERTLEVRRG